MTSELKTEWVETDVLCIGGGPAGLSAAIRARELGEDVVVADKANTLRSGDAGMGNDHFRCYLPEVHGDDVEAIVRETDFGQSGGRRPAPFVRYFLEKSAEMVKLWESWGIPMKYEGRYEFAGHGYPGHPLVLLHYSGQDTKPILTRQALKSGVRIINRVMICDLLTDGASVCGAIGIDTREPRMIVFKSKSVVLASGKAMRLFPGATPAWLFNTNSSPVNTGDGRVMAYRAGCELTNLELSARWAGPRYFARNGKGSWTGVLRDPNGTAVGPFVSKPDKKAGDMTADIYRDIFDDYLRSGRGPVYMDFSGMSDEDYEYMKYWLIHEANTPILDYLEEEHVDVREHPLEFMTYGLFTPGGIYYDEKGQTPMRGLFAAGDEYHTFVIAGAAVFGRMAGESAALNAAGAGGFDSERQRPRVAAAKALFEGILGREDGATWREANIAVQQVMLDYCGLVRFQTLLQAGLKHLRTLKKKISGSLMASNMHELMRCVEVLNIVDLGELIFIAAQERKETRALHRRADYPYTNPLLNDQLLAIRQVDGQPVTEWKKKR
jgi:succinate dehydrogenase/fumarate reductase flavoprotein subunit